VSFVETSREELFQALFESALDAVLIADDNGTYVDLNPAACELIGREREQILGRRIAEFFEMEQGAAVPEAWQSFQEQGTQVGVVKVHRPDGTTRYAGFRARASFRPGRHLSVLRDITEERMTAQALEQKNAELDRLNAELLRSNSELLNFVYAVGHDLGAPLRTIVCFSELLRKRLPDSPEAAGLVAPITAAVRQMQTFLKDLLAYSQANPPSGPMPLISLVESLESATVNLRGAIQESGAVITHDALPSVRADRTQMNRLFQNLLGNAIRYRGDAVPEIRVSARRVGPDWVISVADNGIGIAAEYHERIFQAFKRLHGPDRPGTGLGLALCKRIVENHGGRLWVESEPGRGADFRFSLPA
jgi:PAS domain S-box-containing protein